MDFDLNLRKRESGLATGKSKCEREFVNVEELIGKQTNDGYQKFDAITSSLGRNHTKMLSQKSPTYI